VARVRGAHHILGIKHLLSKLRDSQSAVLLRTTRSQRSEASHEEVQTREGDHIDCKLSEIGVKLTREAQASSDTTHSSSNQVVQVTIGWGGELEGTETDIVQSLVVQDHDLISVLDQLVDGESSIVWLYDGVRDFGGGEDREGLHDTVGVLLTDLGDQEGSHTGTSTTTKGMAELEALEAVATFCLLADDIKD